MFHKGQDRTGWKRPRFRAIGWLEADDIERKLRANGSKESVARIAAEHRTSMLTIQKIAKARSLRIER